MAQQTFNQFLQWEATTRDTIDFKKAYVDMAGDLVAGLLLSQIVYWHLPAKDGATRLRVQRDGHLWIAKGRADWWDEIRITAKQFDRACGILIDKGLVVKANYRFDGLKIVHVRLDHDHFMELWEAAIVMLEETPKAVRGRSVFPKGENRSSPKGKTDVPERVRPLTETTTEITTEKDAVALSDEQQAALDALLGWPKMDPTVARRLAREYEPAHNLGWVGHLQADKKLMADPDLAVRVLVKRIQSGEPAPPPPDRRRYEQEDPDPAELPPSHRDEVMERHGIDAETMVLWEQAQTELQLQMTKATYDQWLIGALLLQLKNGTATIGVANARAVDWLSGGQHAKPIRQTLAGLLGEPVELAFEVLE